MAKQPAWLRAFGRNEWTKAAADHCRDCCNFTTYERVVWFASGRGPLPPLPLTSNKPQVALFQTRTLTRCDGWHLGTRDPQSRWFHSVSRHVKSPSAQAAVCERALAGAAPCARRVRGGGRRRLKRPGRVEQLDAIMTQIIELTRTN